MGITAGSGTIMCNVAGDMAVVIMLCCMLVVLLVVCRKSCWVAETTCRRTQTLDEEINRYHTKVPQKVMIPRYGEAVNRRQDFHFFEVTLDSNSELVFLERSDQTRRQIAIASGALGNGNML